VIEEADVAQEGADNDELAQQVEVNPNSTCTDRLQSRNGSRRVNGNRRFISYLIANNKLSPNGEGMQAQEVGDDGTTEVDNVEDEDDEEQYMD
jgi:hypothetical protein